MENERDFQIRSYGFGELAQLYSPEIAQNSASNRLNLWIKRSEELSGLLHRAGYRNGLRVLTPRQVRIIVEFLGEP